MYVLINRKLATAVRFASMMTSSNGNIFRVTGPLCGEFTGPGEFPTQRPVTRSFDVYFDLRLNKRLSKQPWGWWFETLSWSLWRHRNVFALYLTIPWKKMISRFKQSVSHFMHPCISCICRNVTTQMYLHCFWLVAAATNHIRRDWCGGLQYTLLHSHRLLVVGWQWDW